MTTKKSEVLKDFKAWTAGSLLCDFSSFSMLKVLISWYLLASRTKKSPNCVACWGDEECCHRHDKGWWRKKGEPESTTSQTGGFVHTLVLCESFLTLDLSGVSFKKLLCSKQMMRRKFHSGLALACSPKARPRRTNWSVSFGNSGNFCCDSDSDFVQFLEAPMSPQNKWLEMQWRMWCWTIESVDNRQSH